MGGGSSTDWLSDQQLLQPVISFYRREIVGTVTLHSLQSLQLKKLLSLGIRSYATSQMLVCVFAQVSATAKSSVPAFASCRDLWSFLFCGSWTITWRHGRWGSVQSSRRMVRKMQEEERARSLPAAMHGAPQGRLQAPSVPCAKGHWA